MRAVPSSSPSPGNAAFSGCADHPEATLLAFPGSWEPGGEDVARVQTYVHTVLVLDPVQDVGQMLEPVDNGGSLPGGRLETDLHLAVRGSVEDSVEGLGNPGEALRLAAAYVRSGMRDEERNAQEVAPPCLLEKGDPGPPEEGLVR